MCGVAPTPSKASLDRQICDASDQLEVVIEHYDAAGVALAATKVKLARINARLTPMHRSVAQAQAKVGSIAATVYESSSIGGFASLPGSASASDFIGRLSLINQVAVARERQINALYSAASAYVDQQKMLSQLTTTQSFEYGELRTKRATITTRIAQLKSLRFTAYGPTGMPADNLVIKFVPVFSAGVAGKAVKFAFEQIGKAYKWAASGPNSYDCSGLTMASWRSAGVQLPHNAAAPPVAPNRSRRRNGRS